MVSIWILQDQRKLETLQPLHFLMDPHTIRRRERYLCTSGQLEILFLFQLWKIENRLHRRKAR